MNRVKQFGNDPIILVTNPADLTADVVRDNWNAIANLTADLGGFAVTMIDLRDVDLTFDKYMTLINRDASQRDHGHPIVLLGSNRFLKSYHNAVHKQQFDDSNVSVYHDFSNALRATRKLLKQHATETTH